MKDIIEDIVMRDSRDPKEDVIAMLSMTLGECLDVAAAYTDRLQTHRATTLNDAPMQITRIERGAFRALATRHDCPRWVRDIVESDEQAPRGHQ